MITVYGVIHSVFHLFGSIKKISSEEDIDKIHHSLHHYDHDKKVSYTELLFEDMTGLTGFLMLITITIMAITSLR